MASTNEQAHRRELMSICRAYLGDAFWMEGAKALFVCKHCGARQFGVDAEEGTAGCAREGCKARGQMGAVELVAFLEGLDPQKDLRRVLAEKRRVLRGATAAQNTTGRATGRDAPLRPGSRPAGGAREQRSEPERLSVDAIHHAESAKAGRWLSAPEMERVFRDEETRLGRNVGGGLTWDELHRALGKASVERGQELAGSCHQTAVRKRREWEDRKQRGRQRDLIAAAIGILAGVLACSMILAWCGVLEDEAWRADPFAVFGLKRSERLLEAWQTALIALGGGCLVGFILWTGITERRPRIAGRSFLDLTVAMVCAFVVPWVFVELFDPLLPAAWSRRHLLISTVPTALIAAVALAVAASRAVLHYPRWPGSQPEVSIEETERILREGYGLPAAADAPGDGARIDHDA